MRAQLRICAPVAATAVLLTGLVAVSASPAAGRTPGHTKKQAERNLPRVVAHKWGRRLPDLVDPRTGLLKDNVRSICRGRGQLLHGKRFRRFACIVRPWPFRTQQQLHVMYRAFSNNRFSIRRTTVRPS